MTRKGRVLLNSASGVALFAVNMVVAFVMSPIMVHTLGNRTYGEWELIVALAGYLGMLELGVGSALVCYVADAWSREDRATLDRIFNTGFFSLLGAGLIGFFIMLIGALWPSRFFHLTATERHELIPVLIIFGTNVACYLPRITLSAYLLGLQAHRVVNSIVVMVTLAATVAVYYILTSGMKDPMIWMALSVLGGTILQIILMFLWIALVDRKVRIRISSFSFGTMKQLVGFGVKNAAIAASVGSLEKVINVAIALSVGVAQVVFFAIPSRLMDYARALVAQVASPMMPYYADLAGRGDLALVREASLQTARILQVVSLGAPFGIAILGAPFIRVWIGPQYAEHGRWIIYILSVGLFFQGAAATRERLLVSMGRHGRLALLSSVLAPVCLGLSFVLGWLWGLNGIAIAVTGYAIGLAVSEITLTCWALEMSPYTYLRATVMRFLLPISVMSGVLIGLRQIAYPGSYLQLVVYALLGGSAYLLSAWFIALEPGERAFVARMLRSSRSRDAVDLPRRLEHE